MRHTVARIQDDTGGAARGIQGKDRLDGDVERGRAERLEHDLGHFLAVGLGIHGRLGEEDGVLLRRDAELVVEGVMPDFLHVVPVGDDAVLDWVLEGEDAAFSLRFVAG